MPAAGEEGRAGHVGDAGLDRARQQGGGVQRRRQLDPEEHAAGRHRVAAARRQVALERGAHRVALHAVARADRRHMIAQEAVLDHLVHDALVEAGRVQVGRLLGLQQLGEQRRRRQQVAQPQPRRQHLAEGAEVDRVVAERGRDRRRRRGVVPEVAVGVVLDHRQPVRARRLGERDAARRRQTAPARVLEVGQQVEKTRTTRGRQRLGSRALVVAVDRHEARLVGAEGLQRAEVGRRLDGDRAAGVEQHLAHQVQPLLRAGGDEHARGVGAQALPLQIGGDPLAQRRVALAGGVLQRVARLLAQHARAGLGHRLDRKGVGRRQAAGERDDARALGQLQDLADGRRLEPRRAARQGPAHGVSPPGGP